MAFFFFLSIKSDVVGLLSGDAWLTSCSTKISKKVLYFSRPLKEKLLVTLFYIASINLDSCENMKYSSLYLSNTRPAL